MNKSTDDTHDIAESCTPPLLIWESMCRKAKLLGVEDVKTMITTPLPKVSEDTEQVAFSTITDHPFHAFPVNVGDNSHWILALRFISLLTIKFYGSTAVETMDMWNRTSCKKSLGCCKINNSSLNMLTVQYKWIRTCVDTTYSKWKFDYKTDEAHDGLFRLHILNWILLHQHQWSQVITSYDKQIDAVLVKRRHNEQSDDASRQKNTGFSASKLQFDKWRVKLLTDDNSAGGDVLPGIEEVPAIERMHMTDRRSRNRGGVI
eukprot:scaffold59410_cov66-Attheya_sp.AAC.7